MTAAARVGVALLWLGVWIGAAQAQALPKAVTDQAQALTNQTLKDYAQGKADSVYARLDATMLRLVSAGQFNSLVKQQRLSVPSLGKARAYRITVYRRPEVLLAIDFAGKGTGGAAICGFVIWSGAEAGDLKIRRMEMNEIPAGLAKAGNARDVAVLMAQMRCPPALIKEMTGVVVNLN